MLIQPLVQSPAPGTAFTGSVSPTGVEQAVTRASLPPVEEATRSSASQNQRNPFPAGADAPRQPAPHTTGSATPSAQHPASSARPGEGDSVRQQLQAEADQALLAQLKARDREVRLHEAAHAAVGGRYAGAPTYDYQRGPDGRQYAVGGEVSISTSEVQGDPRATIDKARIIRAAALAPAEPSAQDRRVAAEAAQLEQNARVALREAELAARAEERQRRAEARADDAEETPVEEEAPLVSEVLPEETASITGAAASDSNTAEATPGSDEPDRPNARERLEALLLDSGSIHQHANRLGLVDPRNPHGKSGFLDVIA